MHRSNEARSIPQCNQNKDWHPADVKAALEKAGTSLRKLGIENGFHECSIYMALRNRWPNAESIIGKALGIKPQEIWPSRYNEDGTPRAKSRRINPGP